MKIRTKSHLPVFAVLAAVLFFNTAKAADYRQQTLEQAHTMFREATNTAMYAEAAQQYEFLIQEENIRNGRLFYTLGNTYFLAGDLGRSILNYRRAEEYIPRDADLKHNLGFALEKRVDVIPAPERSTLTQRLLGWHFNSSSQLRWWFFAALYLTFWSAWLWLRKSRRNEARIALAATGVLSVVLAASLVTELLTDRREQPGVITAKEVLARKGDGEIYAPAFMEPLHAGTEFQLLEAREGWWHIRLHNGQSCWIRSDAAETVKL